eukprot:1235506-Prymnesium_polylepis.1
MSAGELAPAPPFGSNASLSSLLAPRAVGGGSSSSSERGSASSRPSALQLSQYSGPSPCAVPLAAVGGSNCSRVQCSDVSRRSAGGRESAAMRSVDGRGRRRAASTNIRTRAAERAGVSAQHDAVNSLAHNPKAWTCCAP